MNDYITRMEEEHAQLTERIEKLVNFIQENPKFSELPAIKQNLLTLQLNTMAACQQVLGLRIGIELAEEKAAQGPYATPGQDDDLNEPLGERTCALEEGCESCQ